MPLQMTIDFWLSEMQFGDTADI